MRERYACGLNEGLAMVAASELCIYIYMFLVDVTMKSSDREL